MSLLSIAAAGVKQSLPCPGILRMGVEITSEIRTSQAGNHYANIKLSGLGEFSGGRILDRVMLTADGGTAWSKYGLARIVSILNASGVDTANTCLAADLDITDANMDRVLDLINGRDAIVRTGRKDRFIEAQAYLDPKSPRDAAAIEALGTKNGIETGEQTAAPARSPASATPADAGGNDTVF